MNSPPCSGGSHTRANIMADSIDVMSVPSRNIMIHDPSGANKHAEYIRELILSHDSEVMLQLMSWCLPGDAEPHRLATTLGSKPTAIANPKQPVNVVFPVNNVNSDLQVDTTMSFKFADVLRSQVYNKGLNPGQISQYVGDFHVNVPDTPMPCYPDYSITGQRGFAINNGVSTDEPHGDTLYLGRVGKSDEHRCFLLTQGQEVVVVYNGIPAGRLISTTLLRVAGSKYTVVATNDLTGNGIAQTTIFAPGVINETGYYALEMSNSNFQAGVGIAGLDGNVLLNGNGAGGSLANGSFWCQLPTSQFDMIDEAVNSYHINGCSLMYTNTSPPAYRLGQTTIFQCPSQSNWLDFVDFNQIANDRDSALIEAVIGGYVFRKPTSMDELAMTAPSRGGTVPGTSEIDFSFELFPTAGPLVIACKIPVSTPTGSSGYWTTADVVEFTSLFKWFTTKIEMTDDPLLLDRFLMHLARIPQYHTNDFHFSDIWEGIKDFFGGVWDTVKEVAPVVAPLIPFLLSPSGGNPNSPGAGTVKAPRPQKEQLRAVETVHDSLVNSYTKKDFASSLQHSLRLFKPKKPTKVAVPEKSKPHPLPSAPKKQPAKAVPAVQKNKATVKAAKKK